MKYCTIAGLLILFFSRSAFAQKDIPDSLKGRDYTFFISRLNEDITDSVNARVYAHAYLALAKSKRNFREAMYAYKNLLHLERPEMRLAYADSMIWAAGRTRDKDLLGSAYLTKGIVYYNQKKYPEALNNYLTANSFIVRTSDEYLRHKVKFNIAQIKYYLGYYEEAVSLLRDCVVFYGRDGGQPYLNSLHSLGLCYNRTGKYTLCSEANALGIAKSIEYGNEELLDYFRHSEAVNVFFLKRYFSAISLLSQAASKMEVLGDKANESVAWFYIGKCYWKINRKEKAIEYFDRVIDQFKKTKYLRPDLLESFKLVADYYKGKSNPEKQLEYLNGQIEAQKILLENYKYLSSRVSNEFDKAGAEAERDAVQAQLDEKENQNWVLCGVVAVLVLFGLGLVVRIRVMRHVHQRKFQEFRESQEKLKSKPQKELPSDETLDINPEIVETVRAQLNKFEVSHKFLKPDTSLDKLAEFCGYNKTYVSKIIVFDKGKKPNDYVNELRIDYVLEKLESDSRLRNYSQKSLALEVGFATSQSFSRAFKEKVGVTPLFYLDRMKKQQAFP